MIINVKSGTGGFAQYVVNGTREKTRDKDKILIVGDPFFTEKIAEQQGSGYFKIMVSVEKKLSNEEMKEILDEVLENVFIGFKEDEYTYSAVLHQDTEHSHWHIIVPKKNLLTNQQLRLYMHNVDTNRYKAIQDAIALKHNLLTIEETKKILAEDTQTAYEKNSTKTIQYTYNLSKSDNKKLAQQQIKELIKNNIDTINSLNDIKELIHKNTDLKVVTENGYNRKKDFYYITVQDNNSKKTSVRGEVFNKDFFKQSKQEQRNQLQVNHKTFKKELLEKKIKANLRRENEKRFKVVRNYGRDLKLSIRTKQREQNHQIRREKNDRAGTNVATGTSRGERAIHYERRQNTTPAERAIQIEEERIRAIETARKARKRVFKELAEQSESLREQSERDSRDAQKEYRRVAEQISGFFRVVRDYVANLQTKLKEIANETWEQIVKTAKQAEKKQSLRLR